MKSYVRKETIRLYGGPVLAALSLAMLGMTGCANLRQPAPEVVQATVLPSVLVVTIYHPDTRVMYVWGGDPRPTAKLAMTCLQIQLSADPSVAPTRQVCPGTTPGPDFSKMASELLKVPVPNVPANPPGSPASAPVKK